MGKKKNASGNLGKSIIKDRFRSSGGQPSSWRHTSDLKDGYDWHCINLNSVTEQNSLDEFLTTAELAGRRFTAEKMNISVIDPQQHCGLPSVEETEAIIQAQEQNKAHLKIPRRPPWDENTTAEALELREREGFLDWRRQLASLQEKEHLILTPFERNLEFWRQLWRVIERSDVVVQIVDARNPLLFRCDDLEKYVKEVGSNKENMILISKADFLTEEQRLVWAEFFNEQGIQVAFWSAVSETERIKAEEALAQLAEEQAENQTEDEDKDEDDESEDGEDVVAFESEGDEHPHTSNIERNLEQMKLSDSNSGSNHDEESRLSRDSGDSPDLKEQCENVDTMPITQTDKREENVHCDVSASDCVTNAAVKEDSDAQSNSPPSKVEESLSDPSTLPKVEESLSDEYSNDVEGARNEEINSQSAMNSSNSLEGKLNSGKLVTGDELLQIFSNVCRGDERVSEGITTVGLVGYPNVGKSSTINALLQQKKVPVSATPGRTKHFQTLFVEPTLCLCDCPGLVMPSFATSKAEMVVNGILPVDQLRDFVPPVSVICQNIPREVLEAFYSINIIKPREGENPNRPATAMEFLNAYAFTRGMMTHKGVPDCRKASRIILKDYVKGRLLYRQPPPGLSPQQFKSVSDESELMTKFALSKPSRPIITEDGTQQRGVTSETIDNEFFQEKQVLAHNKGPIGPRGLTKVNGRVVYSTQGSEEELVSKPWKKQGKKMKKEKTRKMFKHLDVK